MPFYSIKVSHEAIAQQEDAARKARESGSKWPGMSYEDGVIAALDWVFGNDDTAPMDED